MIYVQVFVFLSCTLYTRVYSAVLMCTLFSLWIVHFFDLSRTFSPYYTIFALIFSAFRILKIGNSTYVIFFTKLHQCTYIKVCKRDVESVKNPMMWFKTLKVIVKCAVKTNKNGTKYRRYWKIAKIVVAESKVLCKLFRTHYNIT